MSDYQSSNWRDALRVYCKVLRIVVEPAILAAVMLALDAPWWGFILLGLLWLPLGLIRVRGLRNEWVG